MKLEQSFEIAAPLEQVWAALIDLEQVAPCLPGAAITGRDEEGTYRGTFVIKLGPTTASYNGTIRIEDIDEGAHTATLIAKGTDKRGQGGATATIVNTLHATEGGGTRVEAVTDFTITGRLASFGRGGMIKDISNRLLGEFATCLQQRLSAEPETAVVTAEEAAASAGAEARPEEAAAGEAAATAPGQPSAPPRPPGPAPGPPAQAAPVQGFSLVLGVLGDRAKALGETLAERVKALAPVVAERLKALLARARDRRQR